jgi:hypothetical protein
MNSRPADDGGRICRAWCEQPLFALAALRIALAQRICALLTLLTFLSLSGCILVPRASLYATPTRTPGSGAGCTVQLRGTDVPGAAPAILLTNSLKRVRNETFFGDLALSPSPDVQKEFDEAWLLVEKAKAVKAADGGTVAATMQPDAAESILLSLLPWAADTGATPEDLRVVKDITGRARTLIGDFSGNLKAMNKLLPPEAKPIEAGTARSGQSVVIKTLWSSEKDTFEKLTDLASFRAFHLLSLMSAAHVYFMVQDPDVVPEELDTEVRVFNIARYLSAYFDAYFRGGQFVQATFDEKTFVANLSSRLATQLKKTNLTQAQIQPMLQAELMKLCLWPDASSTGCGSVKLGSTAFVTRAGLTVQFSGVSFSVGSGVSHAYPQVSQFGPQMIRVMVEAVFDANGEHPLGMPNSTACQPNEKLFDPATECLGTGVQPDAKLEQIDMLASASEALSQTATGAVVRGISVSALNNEAVAQMLETLAGVLARKTTEKVLYITSNRGKCALSPVSMSVTKFP